jgi:hypothetical protein
LRSPYRFPDQRCQTDLARGRSSVGISRQDSQNAAKERPARRFSALSIARSDALKAMKFHDNGHAKLGAIGQQY